MANITVHHRDSFIYHEESFSRAESLSGRTGLAVLIIISISLLWQGYNRRKFYRGLPGPPHSLLLGHLPSMIEASGKFPADVHPVVSFTYLLKKYNLWSKGLVYIDTYPLVNDNILMATTPEAAAEITERNFVRHPFFTNFYGRIVGMKSMTLAEGQQWKDMRKTFNPGFSLTNIMTLMPEIVRQSEIFTTILSEIAKNGGFIESLEELARGLTLDIIFRVVLGLETNTQRDPQGNEVGHLLETMSQWLGPPQSMNPLRKINLPKWIVMRWTEWRIKRILNVAILKRWEFVKQNQAWVRTGGKASNELKLVIDLALKHYCEENAGNGKKLNNLSNEYLDTLSDNIKAFIFGGHDTTASTTTYILYELSRNPDILEMVRREHDAVFGPDLDTVPKALLETPHLVNQLPLTIACIKETLRLYPPAAALRLAEPGTSLTLNSQSYPLTSQLVWIAHAAILRSPLQFPNPNLFLPQRFLPPDYSPSSNTKPSTPSSTATATAAPPTVSAGPKNPSSQPINPDAYRPFERGPRNCIGQELAMLELKVILVLVVRRFTFSEGYEELARRKRQLSSRIGDVVAGGIGGVGIGADKKRGDGIPRVEEWGGRAYPVSMASSKPKDGIPVWVREE